MIALAVLSLIAEWCALLAWWPPYYTHGPAVCRWRVRAASHTALDEQGRRFWEMARRDSSRPIKFEPIDATTVMFRESMALNYLWVYPLVLRGCVTGNPSNQPLVVTIRLCIWPLIVVALVGSSGDHDLFMRLTNGGVVALVFVLIAILQLVRFRALTEGFGSILPRRTSPDDQF